MIDTSNETKQPLCSIIIRAYNEEQHIRRLLDGISKQTLKNYEIILVDSGSTDRTVEFAKQFQVNIVNILPEDFSFGRALNLGISHANGKYIVIASAHVYPVYPDWLERLVAPFEAERVGLSYGKQRGTTSTKFSEHRIFAQWFPDSSVPRQSTPFCNNANAAIRKSLWQQHPYDESLSGLEDLEWAHWLMEQGLAISYVAEAEIIHVHNESPQTIFNRYKREAIAFKSIFSEEKFYFWDFIRLFIANSFADIWEAIHQKSLIKNFSSIIWFRWMQFWGTYQGYKVSGPLTWQLKETFYYPGRIGKINPKNKRAIEPIKYSDQE